ncbi:origin recognition complex subunit 5 C-terminus-domain-containing protein [Abortiporus biennis]|nr:origin recognition complex subunit 5 C-terminus-domain-containing protein [Abortiporus biennis]
MSQPTPSSSNEGYQLFSTQISDLISTHSSPFIYVCDPANPRVTTSVLRNVLQDLTTNEQRLQNTTIAYAFVDAICCFTPRVFYDTVINDLADWAPNWEEGCNNWNGLDEGGSTASRFNDSIDGFLHGLKAIRKSMGRMAEPKVSKGKGKARASQEDLGESEFRIVLVVEKAERLKDTLPELIVPLTRLDELTQAEVTTIFVSDIRWDNIRPPLGAAPDPLYLDIPSLSKQSVINRLAALYPSPDDASCSSPPFDPNTYHPSLRPLYIHFLKVLHSVCSTFLGSSSDIDELAYVAAARWPGFVKPILDDYKLAIEEWKERRRKKRRRSNNEDDAMEGEEYEDREMSGDEGYVEEELMEDDDEEDPMPELNPPTQEILLRLTRLFTPSFTLALQQLYPRLTSAHEYATAPQNIPPDYMLSIPHKQAHAIMSHLNHAERRGQTDESKGLKTLPRMAKFILVASFLASTNPAKTDMRMFGRGPDERAKRRRRKGGGTSKAGGPAAANKVPQRLLGPLTFPLDRMLAILGVLLEENDVENRLPIPGMDFQVNGEQTELEISRVAVYAQVNELAFMHLLHKTSPSDKLEISPTFKCGINYETALSLARDLGVALNDIMWEPV